MWQRCTLLYRETHLLANLGWVDYDLGCSTILPSCSGSSANFPSAQAEPLRGWNSQNQSQPNWGLPGDGSSCIMNSADNSIFHQNALWPLSKEPRRIISLNIITKSIGQGIPWSEIFMDRKKSISLPFGNMTKRQGGIDKIGTFSSSSDIFSYLSSWAQSAHSQLKAVWHKTRLLVTLLYST